jgi:hypothetical protein
VSLSIIVLHTLLSSRLQYVLVQVGTVKAQHAASRVVAQFPILLVITNIVGRSQVVIYSRVLFYCDDKASSSLDSSNHLTMQAGRSYPCQPRGKSKEVKERGVLQQSGFGGLGMCSSPVRHGEQRHGTSTNKLLLVPLATYRAPSPFPIFLVLPFSAPHLLRLQHFISVAAAGQLLRRSSQGLVHTTYYSVNTSWG